jgi:hypothetical protein
MVRRRAAAAGIDAKIGSHSFRATGITAYLKNGGTLENTAAMANHASTRTTQLYDRRRDDISLDEVERIRVQRDHTLSVSTAQACSKPISLRACPSMSLQAGLAGILRFPPHRFLNNRLRRELSEIMEYQVDNLGMRKFFPKHSYSGGDLFFCPVNLVDSLDRL